MTLFVLPPIPHSEGLNFPKLNPFLMWTSERENDVFIQRCRFVIVLGCAPQMSILGTVLALAGATLGYPG